MRREQLPALLDFETALAQARRLDAIRRAANGGHYNQHGPCVDRYPDEVARLEARRRTWRESQRRRYRKKAA